MPRIALIHALNHSMFELARGFADEGMPAYVRLQQAEFASEQAGYTATDCSQITCPSSVCYFDYVGRTQVCQHCNGFGTCNGLTGECECNYPASGPSCAQLECLNGCSGHGVCNSFLVNSAGYGTWCGTPHNMRLGWWAPLSAPSLATALNVSK